jgi:hypothetical protein
VELPDLVPDRLKVRVLSSCRGWKRGASGSHCGSGNKFPSIHDARG